MEKEYRYNFNANGTRYQHDIKRTNKRQAIKEAIESAKAHNAAGNNTYWMVYVVSKNICGYTPIAYGVIDGKGRNHYLPAEMA